MSDTEPLAVCCRLLAESQEIIETKNAEIDRLRLTDAEREAIAVAAEAYADDHGERFAATLRGLLERTKITRKVRTMSDFKEVPRDVDGASCPSRCYAAIRAAFEPFQIALEKNETDTLGRLSKDDQVLFVLSGSWTGSAKVTLGDLRKLANAIRSSSLTREINSRERRRRHT